LEWSGFFIREGAKYNAKTMINHKKLTKIKKHIDTMPHT
jgi:hypothetical protein